VKALIRSAADAGQTLQVLAAVEAANDQQKRVLSRKIMQRFGEDLAGRRFALWGLAFKPDTDDMREAPSRIVIADLLQRGAEIVAYDPVAMAEARRVLGDTSGLSYAEAPMDAVEGADALVVVTEWKAFRSPDFERIRAALKQPVIFDGRNLFDPVRLREAGIEYFPIGRRG
jgi:UDPglucose 6-dehydrogenase